MSERINRRYLITRTSQYSLTANEWNIANPILLEGEIGFESDTNLIKIGDGINTWNHLPYQYGIDVIYTSGPGIQILNNREISTTLRYTVVSQE